MKSSKVTILRQIVNDVRKEEHKKYQHVANLYAISLHYPIPYPEIEMENNTNTNTNGNDMNKPIS
jgi:hypothetical protein